jgi:hypothetical protein
MELRYKHVGIVAWVADNSNALYVSLHICSIQTKQEFRWIIALVKKRMSGRSVTVQTFKIELRTAGIV